MAAGLTGADGPGLRLRHSPNHGPRRGPAAPDMVVLHYTGMESAAAALDRLCDPAAEVSAHYLIDLDGAVVRMVAEERRAWHAGQAVWGDVRDVNSASVGIELANPGLGPAAHPYPAAQMAALEGVLRGVLARHAIPPERVVGHACIAPGRKVDPGSRLDWRRLAREGLSVWIDRAAAAETAGETGPETGDAAVRRFQTAAAAFGYPLPGSGQWDAPTAAVWAAYRDRFGAQGVGGPSRADLERLEALAARWPVRLSSGPAGA